MKTFQSDFERSKRRFNFMYRVISTFIAVIFVCTISFWVFVGITAVKASAEIEQRGLKSVIEQIWCGPNNRCL